MADHTGSRGSMPETIGRYSVVATIASGGMATVFLARQHGLAGFGRDVAVKLMHAHLREDEHWTIEFLEEAKLAARIRHPNVVQVVDVGDDASGTFLVMDYVEGETLSGLLKKTRKEGVPMPRPIALRILHDVLTGLHAAHELLDEDGAPLNVVHRDFSPQNVLVGTDGVARLTDFGIAKAASRLTFTHTGTVKGKVAYMAPEQARGLAVDRRCDVWAAGVVAWETLANQRLYPATEDLAVGMQLLTERPLPLDHVDATMPKAISDAVASALDPDLAARCPTAAALAERLIAGQEIADVATVARYVREASTEKLAERRARVAQAVPRESLPSATSASGSRPSAVMPTERRSTRWPLGLAGGAGLAIVIAVIALTRKTPPSPAPTSSAVPAESGIGAASSSVASPPSTTASETVLPGRDVSLTSDVALSACRVGDRAIVPDAATKTLTLHLTSAEASKTLQVQAIAVDGRRVVETLTPTASSLHFRFAPAKTATTGKPIAPTAKPTTTTKPSLADNPYGGK